MNELKIFSSEEFGTVRTTAVDGEPWFVGKDVATALGYKDTSDALKKHVLEEDKLTRRFADSGQNREMYIINESGLYSLIFGSKLDSAKRFKHWVTSDVLPSIRKHGMFAMDDLIANPDLAINALLALKEERARNEALRADNARMKPKEIFADAVSVSSSCILIGELAKIIKQNGIQMGQNRLFTWMRDKEYLISRNGIDYNMPTQKSMELGLFEIKERTINNPDGSVRVTKTVLVTGKGQQYFINKFLDNSRAAS